MKVCRMKEEGLNILRISIEYLYLLSWARMFCRCDLAGCERSLLMTGGCVMLVKTKACIVNSDEESTV